MAKFLNDVRNSKISRNCKNKLKYILGCEEIFVNFVV